MPISDFAARVYSLVSQVPCGRVTTYGEVARKLGTRGYRAIGQVLRTNPYAPVVPCHRVVLSDGRLGGFMGDRGPRAVGEKTRRLAIEGVDCTAGRVTDFPERLWLFSDPGN